MVSKVLVVGILDRFLVVALCECHILEFCGECGVAAVIGPVCIKHADLCHGRISVLFVLIVVLDVKEVFEGHCKV